MIIEKFIYLAIALMSAVSTLYIKKEDIRKALISFLTFQASTWSTSITLVQTGIITYPVREFTKATNVNFIPQFMFFPCIFMWFVLLFPKDRSFLMKVIHYVIFVSIMVWFICFAHKYTLINRYLNTCDFKVVRNGYIRNFLQYGLCHLLVTWFLKKENKHRVV